MEMDVKLKSYFIYLFISFFNVGVTKKLVEYTNSNLHNK